MKLYGVPPTRAIRALWLINELGLDCEMVVDFVAAYTLDWANEVDMLAEAPRLQRYVKEMYERPKAPPTIKEAMVQFGWA